MNGCITVVRKGLLRQQPHDDRGILYLAKAKFFEVIRIHSTRQTKWYFYDKAAGYTCMALCLMVTWLLLPNSVMSRDSKNYQLVRLDG